MRKRFILATILVLIVTVGGVGIGLAWRTNRLDKWLPVNIKEMFGRGEKPEEKPEEKPKEKREYLVFERGGMQVTPAPGPMKVVKEEPLSLYLISKDGKERKMLIEFKHKEAAACAYDCYQIIGDKIYYRLYKYQISKEGEVQGEELVTPLAVVNSKGETWDLGFIPFLKGGSFSVGFRVSPDGKKIAWAYENYSDNKEFYPSHQLWVADINGENKKMVLEKESLPYFFPLEWSKDSSFVYLQASAGKGATNLSKLSLDTGEIEDILTKGESFEDVSLDENLVAYLDLEGHKVGGGWQYGNSSEVTLVIKNITTGEKVFVTKSPKEKERGEEQGYINRGGAEFSPDGKFLVYSIVYEGFERQEAIRSETFLIDIEKKVERLITDIPDWAIPDWAKWEDYSDLVGEEYRFVGKMELSEGEF